MTRTLTFEEPRNRRIAAGCALLLAATSIAVAMGAADPAPAWIAAYREPGNRLIGEALGNTFAWDRLAEMTDRFGHRLSGSPQLEAAIEWAADEMKKDGLENVRMEPVAVPRWVRGIESAADREAGAARHGRARPGWKRRHRAAGDRSGKPRGRELRRVGRASSRARGKIVVFNVPFTTYAETVQYRNNGAARAAAHGARAALVRSVGPDGHQTAHTGALRYARGVAQVPERRLPPKTPHGSSDCRTGERPP